MKNLLPNFIQAQCLKQETYGSFQAYTLFADLSGFTSLTQALMEQDRSRGVETLTRILNQVFAPMVGSVSANGGFISHFSGDAFTAFFPHDNADGVYNCVQHIQAIVAENSQQETPFGTYEIGVKTGISFGQVEWYILGNNQKKQYAFSGEGLHHALEAEKQATKGENLLHQSALQGQTSDFVSIKEGFYLLPQSTFEAKRTATHPIIHPEIAVQFLPNDVLEFKDRGEFRQVVSVFLAFEGQTDLGVLVPQILNLLHTFGGQLQPVSTTPKYVEIVVFFGAPTAHENDAERAANFVWQLKQTLGESVAFKAGISKGQVYAGWLGNEEGRCQYTAIGRKVNLAARFMQGANWGDIFVDEKIASIQGFNFENRGSQNYKGFDKALSTYRLARKTVVNVQKAFMGEMFGRQVELNSLLDWVQPILQGEYGHVAYLYGEAGMGKSRLAYALQEALGNIVQWHTCPCDQILKRSLNPFWSFLRYYFRQSEENTPERNKALFEERYRGLIPKPTNENREDVKKDLEQAIPIIGEQLGLSYPDSLWYELEAKGKYENTLYGIVALFLGMSLQQPVVIELEDLHWIDSDSLELLKRLTHIANLYNYPIFVLCTSRYNAQNEKPILQLQEDIQSNTIDLNYWKEAILDYYTLQQISGKYGEKEGQLSQSLKTLLQAQTKGNPFFAQQLVTYLLENDLLHVKEQFDLETAETYQEWELKAQTLDLPQGIQGILMARIDQLSQRVKEVVKVASVLGREFEVRLLNAVLEREVAQELKNAEQEEIWSVVQQLQGIFKHGLLRDAAYNMQLKNSLQQLHLLAAQSMEELYKDDLTPKYADLCYHYQQTNKVGKIMEYAKEAGDDAANNYRYKDALHFYTLGMALTKEHTGLNEDYIYFATKKINALDGITKYQQAIDLFETILEQYSEDNKEGTLYELRNFYHAILPSYKEIGQLDKTIVYGIKAMQCIETRTMLTKKDYEELCTYNADLGNHLVLVNRFKESIEYLNVAKFIGEKHKLYQMLVNIYGNISRYHMSQLNYTEAQVMLQKAQTFITQKLTKNEPQLLGNWGLYYLGIGEPNKAKKQFAKILAESILAKKTLNICASYSNIAKCYLETGHIYEAIKWLKKLLITSKKASLERNIIETNQALCVMYMNLGEKELMIFYGQEALERSLKYGDKALINFIYLTLCMMELHQLFNYKQAIIYAEKVKLFFKNTHPVNYIYTLEALTEAYQALGNYEKTKQCLSQFEKSLNKTTNNHINETKYYKIYSNSYVAEKNYTAILNIVPQITSILGKESMKTFEGQINILTTILNLTTAHYQLAQFQAAQKWNNKGVKLWNDYQIEMKEYQWIYENMRLQEQLFQFCFGHYTEAIQETENLLAQCSENEQQALAHYQLWQMYTNQILLDESADKDLLQMVLSPEKATYDKNQSLDFYQAIYKEEPRHDFKLKIDELS